MSSNWLINLAAASAKVNGVAQPDLGCDAACSCWDGWFKSANYNKVPHLLGLKWSCKECGKPNSANLHNLRQIYAAYNKQE